MDRITYENGKPENLLLVDLADYQKYLNNFLVGAGVRSRIKRMYGKTVVIEADNPYIEQGKEAADKAMAEDAMIAYKVELNTR